ncbi:probable cytochrome P450 4aa1 [Microplitis demolitor]|uniref:probable cytochrome P450 4aa1 n=1 Tax=Microplitis demolitor TaxID=69319 RepID=UPI0004CDBEF1|nr:probable cytochrome P450 4aa1 [Microplitis demolitor]XP_014297908.1 probable cytochrome P450 4aa1 [Microplitis demolitor]
MSHIVYQLYGPIFRIWLTVFPFVVVLEPEDIKKVLGNSRNSSKVFLYGFLHNFLGKGLLTSDVETWKSHRKIMQPAFHLNVLDKFVGSFNHAARKLVESFSSAGECPTDITNVINDCVYEVLNETVIGNERQPGNKLLNSKDSPFRQGQISLFYRLSHPWLIFDCFYKKTDIGKKEERHYQVLFDACKKKINNNEELNNNDCNASSLLEFMIKTSAKNLEFTEQDIVNECCTFMLAGQDSVGSTLAMTLFMLAKYQKWQSKCVGELNDIFGCDSRDPSFKDLKDMRYLEMVIKETMRLYPSVPMFGRVLGEDVKIGKHVIPKGCSVLIFPQTTHRLSHHYPNPHEFNPENFNSDNSAKRHPYAYLAFSAGSRNCIGYKFALLEMKSIISKVLRHYQLEPVPGKEELVTKFRVTARAKGGLWIKIKPRMSYQVYN